ncbi:hypothetical protein Aduo_019675 [Ancylostoma duodenale]
MIFLVLEFDIITTKPLVQWSSTLEESPEISSPQSGQISRCGWPKLLLLLEKSEERPEDSPSELVVEEDLSEPGKYEIETSLGSDSIGKDTALQQVPMIFAT